MIKTQAMTCILTFVGIMAVAGCSPDRTGLAYPVESEVWRHQWVSQFYSPLVLIYRHDDINDTTLTVFNKATRYGSWYALENMGRAALVQYDKVIWAGTQIVPLRHGGHVSGLLLLKEAEEGDGHFLMNESGVMFNAWYFSLDKEDKTRISKIGCIWVPLIPQDWVCDVDNDGNDEFMMAEQFDSETHRERAAFHIVQWSLTLMTQQLDSCVVELPEGVYPCQITLKHNKNTLELFYEVDQPAQLFGTFRKDKAEWKFEKASPTPNFPSTTQTTH